MMLGARMVEDQDGEFVGMLGVLTIAAAVFLVYIAGWATGSARPTGFVGIATPPELIPYVSQVWPIEHDEVQWPPDRVLTTEQLTAYVGTNERTVVTVRG